MHQNTVVALFSIWKHTLSSTFCLGLNILASKSQVFWDQHLSPIWQTTRGDLRILGVAKCGRCWDSHCSMQDQARSLSNIAYNVGSFMLELSLAASNLSLVGAGNAGPLLCAQTGFLSTDGTHPHVTNRIPGHSHMDPGMHRAMRMASELLFWQAEGFSGIQNHPSFSTNLCLRNLVFAIKQDTVDQLRNKGCRAAKEDDSCPLRLMPISSKESYDGAAYRSAMVDVWRTSHPILSISPRGHTRTHIL